MCTAPSPSLLRPQVNVDAAEHGAQSHTVQVSGVCDMIVHPPGQWYRGTQTVSTCSWLKTSAPAGGLIKSLMLAGWSWGPYSAAETLKW